MLYQGGSRSQVRYPDNPRNHDQTLSKEPRGADRRHGQLYQRVRLRYQLLRLKDKQLEAHFRRHEHQEQLTEVSGLLVEPGPLHPIHQAIPPRERNQKSEEDTPEGPDT